MQQTLNALQRSMVVSSIFVLAWAFSGCSTTRTVPMNPAPKKYVASPGSSADFNEIEVDMETAVIPTKTKWVRRIRMGSYRGSNFRQVREDEEFDVSVEGAKKNYRFKLESQGAEQTDIMVSEGLTENRREHLKVSRVFGHGNADTNLVFSLMISGDQPTETRGVLMYKDKIYSVVPLEKPSSSTLPVGYDILDKSRLIARVDATQDPRVWFAEDQEMNSGLAGGILCLLMRSVY